MGLYSKTFYSEELNQILSEEFYVTQMLSVEAALASAQAKVGIIPDSSAEIIGKCAELKNIDIETLKSDIVMGGNAAIPLVKQLTLLVKLSDFEASKHVHFGATSQDIIDTATVLQLSEAAQWFLLKTDELLGLLRQLSLAHQDTLMIGRTLLQQAKPITFGLKAALWFKSLKEDSQRLELALEAVKCLQMAGAVGAGNSRLTEEVTDILAADLGLKNSGSWQSSRGQITGLASAVGILSGNLGKISRDISLLMQTEIAEVFEGAAEGKGGSSTMPHKRNPVNCALILASATRVPALVSTMFTTLIQEQERSAGIWHAEWETMNELLALTGGMLEKSIDLMTNLEVDKSSMLANLELTKGLIYAENVMLTMAAKVGKLQAHELVEKACKLSINTGRHLKEIIAENPQSPENLEELFSTNNALEYSRIMTNKILNA